MSTGQLQAAERAVKRTQELVENQRRRLSALESYGSPASIAQARTLLNILEDCLEIYRRELVLEQAKARGVKS